MQTSNLLKKFSSNKPCYYCGEPPPSSKEHAPPKFMFKAFDCDSITVPSCDNHNTNRNLDDQKVISFFQQGLYYCLKTGSVTKNALDALEKAHETVISTKGVNLRPLINDSSADLRTPFAHIESETTVKNWIRQLTAAICWSVVGEYLSGVNWNSAAIYSRNFHSGDDSRTLDEAADEVQRRRGLQQLISQTSIYWWPGWSSYPNPYPADIYRFEISFLPGRQLLDEETKNDVLFRHWFYSEFSWHVYIRGTSELKTSLQQAVREVKRS